MDSIFSIMETARWATTGSLSFISQNMSLDLVIKIALGYFFVIWGAFIIWVIKDITNRTSNILIQAVSIFIVLFFTPIFGLPIYLLIRPRTTIFEQYYEELEDETEEDEDHLHHCTQCGYPVEPDFHYCPKCRNELIRECVHCKKSIRTDWAICPYCGKDPKPENIITVEKKTKTKKEGIPETESSPENEKTEL